MFSNMTVSLLQTCRKGKCSHCAIYTQNKFFMENRGKTQDNENDKIKWRYFLFPFFVPTFSALSSSKFNFLKTFFSVLM